MNCNTNAATMSTLNQAGQLTMARMTEEGDKLS